MAKTAPTLTLPKAHAVLGLKKGADLAAIKAAFHERIGAVHPDQPGGDPELYSHILLAYRLLQANLPRPGPEELSLNTLAISPHEACFGGKRRVAQSIGSGSVTLPAGLRNGELFELGSETVEITIRPEGNMSVEGDHLFLTLEVPTYVLQSGGRLEFQIFDRRYQLWVSRALAEVRQIHLPGLGLPERDSHTRGDAFIVMVPFASEADGTRAQKRRQKFIEDWITA